MQVTRTPRGLSKQGTPQRKQALRGTCAMAQTRKALVLAVTLLVACKTLSHPTAPLPGTLHTCMQC